MNCFDNLETKKLLHVPSNEIRQEKYYLINYNGVNYRILKNKYQLISGFELEVKNLLSTDKTEKEEIERISLTRTKSRIRELCLCNNFEFFGTITINGYLCNRYELDDCQRELKKILKAIKRKNNDLRYIIITEKHKDGAFHFHGLFSGIDLENNIYGYLSNKDLSKLGYNSFSLINDYNKTCNYIMKYITKDCIRNSHNQVFIRSKGLKVATKEELDLSAYDIEWKFENDFACFYDINLENLSDYDKKVITDLLGI